MRRLWALPLVPLYAAGVAVRSAALRLGVEKVQRLARPVVSVGSLSAGGAGKTPFVIALARLMMDAGWHVDILSRGYGRTDTAVLRVDPMGSAERYGDEPLLIARDTGLPVYVAARRFEAGQLAERDSGADVHLLDDGFQHRQLDRDVDAVLVSSEDLSDALLPVGNLRERLGALRRATIFAVSADDDQVEAGLRAMGLQQPVWRFRREMVVPKIAGPAYAFCGIARPEQFFTGLEKAGMKLAAKRAYRDHYAFRASDLRILEQFADRTGASGGLVTTVKDWVRMGALGEKLAQTVPVHTVALRTVLEDKDAVMSLLETRLERARRD